MVGSERGLEQFKQGGLDGVVYLLPRRLSVNASARDATVTERVLNRGKAAIGLHHCKSEAMLETVRVSFLTGHSRLRRYGLKHSKERRPVKFATLLRNEHKVARVLPSLAFVKPCVQHAGDG